MYAGPFFAKIFMSIRALLALAMDGWLHDSKYIILFSINRVSASHYTSLLRFASKEFFCLTSVSENRRTT